MLKLMTALAAASVGALVLAVSARADTPDNPPEPLLKDQQFPVAAPMTLGPVVPMPTEVGPTTIPTDGEPR